MARGLGAPRSLPGAARALIRLVGALVPLTLAPVQAAPAGAAETALLAELALAQGARDQVWTLQRRNLAPPPLQSEAFQPASTAERRAPEPLAWIAVRPAPAVNERRALEPLAEAAAQRHGVAVNFFKRLIRQESGYNPFAVSHAGAQGIAQFMPATASLVGLDDPFDPAKALPKSAEHLADLQRRLGNEGLAAAAYNAGEGRVRAWLAGRSLLPFETQNYVLSITGRPAHEWAPPGVAPTLAVAYASTQASRAQAGPTFTRLQSAEWQIGIRLMPEKSHLTALLSEGARTPASRAAGSRATRGTRTAAALTGEKALCASMGGCIVATAY